MRPVPWRHKLVNVGTWRSLCICWWQSGPELAATELVLCIFYPGISKPIIPNKLLLSTMWKMYVSYYELILSLHKRKHKSAWLTQHAEVLLGTETKVFFLLWVSWPRSVRKLIHVHTILPAVKVFSLPPKENKTFFLFSPLLFFFLFLSLHLFCLIPSPNNLWLSWPQEVWTEMEGESNKNVMKYGTG